MTIIQIGNVLRQYGVDVLLLALGVAFLTWLLKRTLLKKFSQKALVLLPFALGFVFYAVYCMIATLSTDAIGEALAATFEGGFSCGCAATLVCVIVEQFLCKGETKVSPLIPLLEGYVPEESKQALSDALLAGYKSADNLNAFVRETVKTHAPTLSSEDVEMCSVLLAAFLLTLKE